MADKNKSKELDKTCRYYLNILINMNDLDLENTELDKISYEDNKFHSLHCI